MTLVQSVRDGSASCLVKDCPKNLADPLETPKCEPASNYGEYFFVAPRNCCVGSL